MISLFETLWNFFYWFSLYGLFGFQQVLNSGVIIGGSASLDNIRNLITHNVNISYVINDTTMLQINGLYPISLNVATKLWFVLFFGALYWIYFVATLKVQKPEELR